MTDVSSTIIVGEWTISPRSGLRSNNIIVIDSRYEHLVLVESDARDLAHALQVWIERSAKVEE